MIETITLYPDEVDVSVSLIGYPLEHLVTIGSVLIIKLIHICARGQRLWRCTVEIAHDDVRNEAVTQCEIGTAVRSDQYVALMRPKLEQSIVDVRPAQHA